MWAWDENFNLDFVCFRLENKIFKQKCPARDRKLLVMVIAMYEGISEGFNLIDIVIKTLKSVQRISVQRIVHPKEAPSKSNKGTREI